MKATRDSFKIAGAIFLAASLLASVVLIVLLRRSGNTVSEMLAISSSIVFIESGMVFAALASRRWLLA